jgi:hypothetical protein
MKNKDFIFQKDPNANYQKILKNVLNDILDAIKTINLNPNIQEINEISGFNTFNAESVPFFGDNYISINAGVCFHCHILARCIHVYFCEVNNELHMGKIIRASKKREFVKTCIALLSGNFTKGFSLISVLTEYGDLLHGMEVFIVAHELGHIIIHDMGRDSIPFQDYFDSNMIAKILSDEEIAADAFAIIVLSLLYKTKKYSIDLIYAPRGLFYLFSLFENHNMMKKPKNHPSNAERYIYLKDMVNSIHISEMYNKFDTVIENLWDENRKTIINKIDSSIKEQEYYLEIINEVLRSANNKNTN